jgi:hypothetical protein
VWCCTNLSFSGISFFGQKYQLFNLFMMPASQQYAQGAGSAPSPRDIAAAPKTKKATGTVKLSLHCHRSYDQEICLRNNIKW